MKSFILLTVTLVLAACAPVDHHERYAGGARNVVEVEAGSVRSDDEARSLCPSVCGGRGWAGTWRRTGHDHRAVCGCAANAPVPVAALPQEAPTACSVQSNSACAGCSVSCPAGQQTQCVEGVAQQQTDGSSVCVTPARCLCR